MGKKGSHGDLFYPRFHFLLFGNLLFSAATAGRPLLAASSAHIPVVVLLRTFDSLQIFFYCFSSFLFLFLVGIALHAVLSPHTPPLQPVPSRVARPFFNRRVDHISLPLFSSFLRFFYCSFVLFLPLFPSFPYGVRSVTRFLEYLVLTSSSLHGLVDDFHSSTTFCSTHHFRLPFYPVTACRGLTQASLALPQAASKDGYHETSCFT